MEQHIWTIFWTIISAIALAAVWHFRDKVRKRIFARKVKKIFEPIMRAYEEKVLPEYVEKTPKIEVVLNREDLPSPENVPFGYVFVPVQNERVVANILIANAPKSSSLRMIGLCFDETLRKSLFRYLSYSLALEIGKENIAERIRDLSLREEREAQDFEIIERLYSESKLTSILFNEAMIRLRKTKRKPTISDVKEFSRFARKLAETEIEIVRVGPEPVEELLSRCKETRKNIVLLARGDYTKRAERICEEICKGIDKELGIGY